MFRSYRKDTTQTGNMEYSETWQREDMSIANVIFFINLYIFCFNTFF